METRPKPSLEDLVKLQEHYEWESIVPYEWGKAEFNNEEKDIYYGYLSHATIDTWEDNHGKEVYQPQIMYFEGFRLDRLGKPFASWKGEGYLKVCNSISEAMNFVQGIVDQEQSGPFFSAYEIDRAYGGPEEGGWYYDNWSLIEGSTVDLSALFRIDNIKGFDRVKNIVRWELESLYCSYTVKDTKVAVMTEFIPGWFETREKPHYE
jgi:hypothetical protein